MSKRRGNFEHNYPLTIKYLKDNKIEYIEYAEGQHLRIMGDVSLVDLWPSRMTYHIVESENPYKPSEYSRLDFCFNEAQLERVLNGGE